MDIGTFSGKGSDFAYMGTMERFGDSTSVQGDHNDAVIVWGDNINAPDGADNFRILFSAPFGAGGTGTAGTYNSLEVSRYSPLGRVGIGNFSATANGGGSGVQPLRRLEVYGENNDTLLNAAAPQLRLTHTPNANVNLGVNTDFETRSTGDLYIHPTTGGNDRFVGINTTSPSNTLEINSLSTYSAGTIGNSGLVFTDLRSGNLISAGNGKVLTVDANGQVILVPDNDGGTVTSSCPNAYFIPKMNTAFNITCSQIYDNSTATTVGIGMGSSVNTLFRLHIKGDFLIQPSTGNTGDLYMQDASAVNKRVLAMYGSSGNSALAVGAEAGGLSSTANRSTYIGYRAGTATTSELRNTFIGGSSGEAWSGSSSDGWNTFVGASSGLVSTAGNHNTFIGEKAGGTFATGDSNTFIGAESGNGGLTTAGRNNILIGNLATVTASNGFQNIVIGNRATALQTGGTSINRVSIGYRNRSDCDNCFTIAAQVGTDFTEQQVGIGYTNPTVVTITPTPTGSNLAKLYVRDYNFGGTAAFFNGSSYASAAFTASDVALKQNIVAYTDASAIIDQLEAKSFDFKHQDYPSLALPLGSQIGFLAQDVEVVAPQLVHWFSNPATLDTLGNITVPQVDFKAVNYAGLVPILFTAIKQQKAMLDSLALVVSNCCSNPQPLINNGENSLTKSSVVLSNNEAIILNQNTPNPFKDKTEISYNIPESVKVAVIMFYDQTGKVLHKFEISHHGQGSLTVYGEDLSSGIYSYTLIIDGENHQTKRMVKQ